MGAYTIVPLAYALASVGVFILLTEFDWFGDAFLTFGPTLRNASDAGGRSFAAKAFCGRPIRSRRQYWGLLIISFANSLLSTFYNELMRPFWYNVVNPDEATRRATLNREMNGSLSRLFRANIEAEIYLKFAHVLTLFLALVDAWVILAQLCGSAIGSTCVILWHWKRKTLFASTLNSPDPPDDTCIQ